MTVIQVIVLMDRLAFIVMDPSGMTLYLYVLWPRTILHCPATSRTRLYVIGHMTLNMILTGSSTSSVRPQVMSALDRLLTIRLVKEKQVDICILRHQHLAKKTTPRGSILQFILQTKATVVSLSGITCLELRQAISEYTSSRPCMCWQNSYLIGKSLVTKATSGYRGRCLCHSF